MEAELLAWLGEHGCACVTIGSVTICLYAVRQVRVGIARIERAALESAAVDESDEPEPKGGK